MKEDFFFYFLFYWFVLPLRFYTDYFNVIFRHLVTILVHWRSENWYRSKECIQVYVLRFKHSPFIIILHPYACPMPMHHTLISCAGMSLFWSWFLFIGLLRSCVKFTHLFFCTFWDFWPLEWLWFFFKSSIFCNFDSRVLRTQHTVMTLGKLGYEFFMIVWFSALTFEWPWHFHFKN